MEEIEYRDKVQNLSWALADRWFRIIEMSLITGALLYVAKITGNILLWCFFGISWLFIYIWFEDFGFFLQEVLGKKFSFWQRLFTRTLATVCCIALFWVITGTMVALVTKGIIPSY
jgi:hypothetical protein